MVMMDLSDLKYQFDEWFENVQDYFAHLSKPEQYGWIGEGVGAALFLTGLILLFV